MLYLERMNDCDTDMKGTALINYNQSALAMGEGLQEIYASEYLLADLGT
jgi:hypothetical protein